MADSKEVGHGPPSLGHVHSSSVNNAPSEGTKDRSDSRAESSRPTAGSQHPMHSGSMMCHADVMQDQAHMSCLVQAFEQQKARHMSFCGYLAYCLLATVSVSAATVLLFSSMGAGKDVLDFLQENESFFYPLVGAPVLILMALYLLDFYLPPHMPGQMLRLWPGDQCLGRSAFFLAIVLLYLSAFFAANSIPSLPLIMAVTLVPLAVGVVRLIVKPTPLHAPVSKRSTARSTTSSAATPTSTTTGKPDGESTTSLHTSVQTQVSLHNQEECWKEATILSKMVGHEEDVGIFHKAVLTAFVITAIAVLVVWLCWAILDGQALKELDESHLTSQDRQELWILWSTPLVVSICNFVFALFAGLRVGMHNLYVQTVRPTDGYGQEDLETKYEQAIQHVATVVKLVGCFLIVTLGLLYVGAQLLYTDNDIASMVMGLLGSLFVVFVIFTYLAFNRVVVATGKWLWELPVWNTVASVMKSDWFRALICCLLLVPSPALLAFSVATQCLRRCRGTYRHYPALVDKAIAAGRADPRKLILTPRVHSALLEVRSWNHISIIAKCYVLCCIFIAYLVCPIPLNIGLSWTQDVLQDVNFGLIMVLTFLIGVTAFLLPPVPGMTIYIFGGLMLSSTCPVGGVGSDTGFWTGAVINIGLGYFLKLVACAVQQVCIGGRLGKSLWVRHTIGVHKVHIRCIEKELQRPGLPMGKVAILCGGPDWPTSVLAGILGLSLVQCELGTLPIIFFVIPCSLTGSFYLRRGTTEVWTRAANMMILTSVVVNLVLWAVSAWAIQHQLEANHAELTRPLPQHVDLAWLDHKQAELNSSAAVNWTQVPALLKFLFAVGAGTQIILCVLFQFRYQWFFTSFEVSDDINDLESWRDVVTTMGVAGLAAFIACWSGWILFNIWRSRATYAARMEVNARLDQGEEEWKRSWVQKANAWLPPQKSRSFSGADAVQSQPLPIEEATMETTMETTKETTLEDMSDLQQTSAGDQSTNLPSREEEKVEFDKDARLESHRIPNSEFDVPVETQWSVFADPHIEEAKVGEMKAQHLPAERATTGKLGWSGSSRSRGGLSEGEETGKPCPGWGPACICPALGF